MRSRAFRAAIPLGIAALFFCTEAVADRADGGLAWKLFSEGDELLARREALRQLASTPEDPATRYVAAAAAVRLDPQATNALQKLTLFAESDPPMPWSTLAALDLGRIHARRNEYEIALQWHARAFFAALSGTCFRHAAMELERLFNDHENLAAAFPALRQQVASVRSDPPRRRCSVCFAEPTPARRRGVRPEVLMVGFYRSLVAPAIGHRCELHPSCSEYFVQAGREYGWRSIPLIADRMVREPGVAARRERPVLVGGSVRYGDPVEAHTFWLARYRKRNKRAATRDVLPHGPPSVPRPFANPESARP